MGNVGWTIWLVRTVVAWAVGTMLASVVAFKVADYVVSANTSSANEAMRGLQSSIDNLTSSVRDDTAVRAKMQEQMGELMRRSDNQEGQIAAVREGLTRVQNAVQDSGINIRIGSDKDGRTIDWKKFFEDNQIEPGDDIFLKLRW